MELPWCYHEHRGITAVKPINQPEFTMVKPAKNLPTYQKFWIRYLVDVGPCRVQARRETGERQIVQAALS